MGVDHLLADDIARLQKIEVEYWTTLAVVATLVERIQKSTGETEIHVTDKEVTDRPDLKAWRTSGDNYISLVASR